MNRIEELSAPRARTHGNGRFVHPIQHVFSEVNRWKMDRDLYLLSALAQGVERAYKGRLVVDFGWAVDALCDGKPTRVHHDMDARLILPEGVDQGNVFDFAARVLAEHSLIVTLRSLMWVKSDWARSPGTCTCSKMTSRSGHGSARHGQCGEASYAPASDDTCRDGAGTTRRRGSPPARPGRVVIAPRPTASPPQRDWGASATCGAV